VSSAEQTRLGARHSVDQHPAACWSTSGRETLQITVVIIPNDLEMIAPQALVAQHYSSFHLPCADLLLCEEVIVGEFFAGRAWCNTRQTQTSRGPWLPVRRRAHRLRPHSSIRKGLRATIRDKPFAEYRFLNVRGLAASAKYASRAFIDMRPVPATCYRGGDCRVG
jgi:hypothetical protein